MCPECGNKDVDYYLTRVIGYMKRVKQFLNGSPEKQRRFTDKQKELWNTLVISFWGSDGDFSHQWLCCPNHCPRCHSKYLWDDIGTSLTAASLETLVAPYAGKSHVSVSWAVLNHPESEVWRLADYISKRYPWRDQDCLLFRKSLLPAGFDSLHGLSETPAIHHFRRSLRSPHTNQQLLSSWQWRARRYHV